MCSMCKLNKPGQQAMCQLLQILIFSTSIPHLDFLKIVEVKSWSWIQKREMQNVWLLGIGILEGLLYIFF